MAANTFGRLAEQILTTFYKGQRSDDANYTIRHICEFIAQEIAFQARKNAFENSNAGETTYANDMFTSTFTNVAVNVDTVLKQKYVTLPQIPAALPNNQEIAAVTPYGIKGRRRQIVPMKQKDKFMHDFFEDDPSMGGVILYYIENGRLYFDNIQEYMFEAVNITMVGAVSSTGNIQDAVLNVPKSVEIDIVDRILARLYPTNQILKDNTNDAVSP